MKKIAVVGSLNVDYVVYIDRAPKTGETVLAEDFKIIPGGKGANQCYALGKMGASVAMFGAVGNDANGELELQNLKSSGADITHVIKTDSPTGTAFITVNKDGDNSIIVVQGANKNVSKQYIDQNLAALCEYDIIIFQLEIPMDTVIYAVEKLSEAGKVIVLDPAPAPGILPQKLLSGISYIKPNEKELFIITGNRTGNIEAACADLLDKGVYCVVASLGEKGSYLSAQKRKGQMFPARRVETVDTTAAGDSFLAGFCYALSMGIREEEAVQFATEIAAVVVQKEGAQSSIPDSKEIHEIWKKLFEK